MGGISHNLNHSKINESFSPLAQTEHCRNIGATHTQTHITALLGFQKAFNAQQMPKQREGQAV